MTLTNTTDFPPGGFKYREPSINWENPEPMQGLVHAVNLLMIARAQNPASGLNPSYEACLESIKAYTCERLKNNPDALERFCSDIPDALRLSSAVAKSQGRQCASCGRR